MARSQVITMNDCWLVCRISARRSSYKTLLPKHLDKKHHRKRDHVASVRRLARAGVRAEIS